MKFALFTVTYSGLFYAGEALSLEEQIHKARALGFDGLAIETKRPVASPVRPQPGRSRADQVGRGRSGHRALRRREHVELRRPLHGGTREQPRHDARRPRDGAATSASIWSRSSPRGPGSATTKKRSRCTRRTSGRRPVTSVCIRPISARWQRAVEGIREVAGWAADMGITLALQNHAPVTTPWLRGRPRDAAGDRSSEREALSRRHRSSTSVRATSTSARPSRSAAIGIVVYSHYGAWNFSEGANGEVIQDPSPSFGGQINYHAFLDALNRVGYDGYLASEYCVPALKNHAVAGIDEVDRGTRLALQYMRQIHAALPAGEPTPALSAV